MQEVKTNVFLMWMQASRPGNVTLEVKFCAESDFAVNTCQALHLEAQISQEHTCVYVYICFGGGWDIF